MVSAAFNGAVSGVKKQPCRRHPQSIVYGATLFAYQIQSRAKKKKNPGSSDFCVNIGILQTDMQPSDA